MQTRTKYCQLIREANRVNYKTPGVLPEVPGRRGDVRPRHFHRGMFRAHGEACEDMFLPQVGTAQFQRPSQTSLQGARLGWDMKARHDQDPDLRWNHGRKVLR